MNRFFCSFLLMLSLTGCNSDTHTDLVFEYKYRGEKLHCSNTDVSLMMYLSNFNNNGAIDLKAGQFSNTNVALIGANCDKSAWQISLAGEVEPGGSLTFDVGVPFDFNHSNPLTAMAPLNVSEMFWSWQLGHKFLRLDLATDFSFHLGSTGCKSPSRVRTPIEQCEQPNRFTFKIDNFDRNKAIVFDIDALLKNVSTEQSCMSDPSNPVCASLFSNLKKPIFYQE